MRAFLIFLFLLSLSACSGTEPLYNTKSYVFGTMVDISIYGESESDAQAISASILREFQRIHDTYHAWKPSELNNLNRAFARGEKPVKVSVELASMLSTAQALAEQSHHQFNPAIGHLIQLWGFQQDTFDPVDVSEQSLAQYLNRPTTMKDIVIDQQLVYSKNPYIKLDLGGYAKGYALDVAVKQLAQYGVKNALINIGGNIIAIGKHGDQPWRVGIQHPRKPNAIASLNLESGWAIGTSGDYQRYFIKDGKRYCHIINPNTGKPAEGTQSVTVLIPPQPNAGTLSDVASKPIFIEDISKKQQAASLMNIKDYLIIQADGKVYLSPSMRPRLTWLDQEAEKVAKVLH